MVDISSEETTILNATRGEEVRDAIISAIQKINQVKSSER